MICLVAEFAKRSAEKWARATLCGFLAYSAPLLCVATGYRVQGNKKIGIADLSFSDPFNAEQKPLNALKIFYGDLDLIRLSPFTLPDSAFTLPPPAQQCERSHRAKQRGGGLGNYSELSHVAIQQCGATCKIR